VRDADKLLDFPGGRNLCLAALTCSEPTGDMSVNNAGIGVFWCARAEKLSRQEFKAFSTGPRGKALLKCGRDATGLR